MRRLIAGKINLKILGSINQDIVIIGLDEVIGKLNVRQQLNLPSSITPTSLRYLIEHAKFSDIGTKILEGADKYLTKLSKKNTNITDEVKSKILDDIQANIPSYTGDLDWDMRGLPTSGGGGRFDCTLKNKFIYYEFIYHYDTYNQKLSLYFSDDIFVDIPQLHNNYINNVINDISNKRNDNIDNNVRDEFNYDDAKNEVNYDFNQNNNFNNRVNRILKHMYKDAMKYKN